MSLASGEQGGNNNWDVDIFPRQKQIISNTGWKVNELLVIGPAHSLWLVEFLNFDSDEYTLYSGIAITLFKAPYSTFTH